MPDIDPVTGKVKEYNDNQFSKADIASNESRGIDGYLGTPDGSIYKWDHETGVMSKFNPEDGSWVPTGEKRGSRFNKDDKEALEKMKKKKNEADC